MSFDCKRRPEKIHPSVFVADTARIFGDVTIGADSGVWYGAVIRGDVESITIGMRTSIQDGSVIHADVGYPTVIGDEVTVGHGAIVHGATVEDGALIGIGAIVLNGARVGAGALVAAGALILEGSVIPPRTLAVGVPAKVVRELTDEQLARMREGVQHYVELARAYQEVGHGR
ncbi:MAG TPA: gamma carbonic anhydrase family protein [Anaerolineae bacterium]|nr:gamma carbonic anhydrase family protein [Anaerolineae bacterium]HIQ06024.1 gamma carbonic anhydrase family protein [Anaerolineae bacterium]